MDSNKAAITEEATSADMDSNKAANTEEAESGLHLPSDKCKVKGSCSHDASLHIQLMQMHLPGLRQIYVVLLSSHVLHCLTLMNRLVHCASPETCRLAVLLCSTGSAAC